jgi:LmbE family N-acetylglucosaminyl deacetylase
MLKLELSLPKDRPLNILCLGAHSDDIEIGCGGTILKLLSTNRSTSVYWVVLGAAGEREKEARESAERFLAAASHKEILVKGFRDSFFPYIGAEIKEYFEEIKKQVSPDVIFTHFRHDLHQDHRLVSELTWNTFRDHLILEYEVIKYDGDLGTPNAYVHLSDEHARAKVKHILDVFKSQGSRSWFTEDAFMSIMRIRGLESNAPQKFAEGFYCRKLVLGER